MIIYQRYLSKSLILFSSFLFLIVFFLESNFGFKIFFNVTNYFFLGLKTEEISGNWRNFTLKNIHYNFFGISVKAKNIHIFLNPLYFFKKNNILRKIETKNLVLSLNNRNFLFFKNNYLNINNLKNNVFINSIFLEKIISDKILLKLNNKNITLFNVHTGLKLINNNINILPTYIDSINFKSNFLNCNRNNQIFLKNINIFSKNKINNFVSYFLKNKKFSLPININIKYIKLRKIIIFNKKFRNILFSGYINDKLVFKLKFNDFFKFNIDIEILLNNLTHPLYINLDIQNLYFPINKNLIFTLKFFNIIFKGTIDKYYLSLKNIINIPGMPLFFLNILANGNLTNIFFKKINFIPLKSKNKKLENIKSKNISHRFLSQLSGHINLLSNFSKEKNSIIIPKFNFISNLIDRKLLISGSLYYNKIDNLKIPKIIFSLGKNQGFISGVISKKININSAININNLSYFLPNLKGDIISTLNIHGYTISPIFLGFLSGENIFWNNIIYLNYINILSNFNADKNFTKSIFIKIKKIIFLKYNIDFLDFKFYWNNNNQKFYFFLKNKNLIIKFLVNSNFNYEKGIWNGILKKITCIFFKKKWIINSNPITYYDNKHTKKVNKVNKIQNSAFSFFDKIQNFLLKSTFNSSFNFKTNLFFKTQFILERRKILSNMKILIYSKNLIFQKKIKSKLFLQKLSFFKLNVDLKKNNLKTKWIIYFSKNKKNKLFGFLNIYDFLNKNNIKSKFFLLRCPCIILNFFISDLLILNGICTGNMKISGVLYQPKILADIYIKNFYIKSDKILNYIFLFFNSSFNLVKYMKINQEILIKKGNMLFVFYFTLKDNTFNLSQWNILFNSNEIVFFIFPRIALNISSRLNFYYIFSKYNLIGYFKSFLFNFKVNAKNFIL
ncbi:Translocation and assembly module subunit TamB [Buchnera aphidicola (Protaphis terricola)]|uniref:hypothetical protein n=1 Tax=Buchnera aphidicola TaxID=9 RepID=UPI00346491D9